MKLTDFNKSAASTLALSCLGSLQMLKPSVQLKKPVIFTIYVGAIITTGYTLFQGIHHSDLWFNAKVACWLWLTVIIANFADSLAECRGKIHAESYRKTKGESNARLLVDGKERNIHSSLLNKGDVVLCKAGDVIPADGDVCEGIATIDESAITGESAPVIRESGSDRSAVTAGSIVVSDQIKIIVTSEPGKSYLDQMIQFIEGSRRQKTPNEMALHIVLCALTILFLLRVCTLRLFADYSLAYGLQGIHHAVTIPSLIALFACSIPTSISALISAIGIAGMGRLIRRNVIAKTVSSVEIAGDIDLLILDKTGTITFGNRVATAFVSYSELSEKKIAEIAQLASLSDETPEGRSIVVLAKKIFDLRAEGLDVGKSVVIPFSSITKISGVDFLDESGSAVRSIRKGSPKTIKEYIEKLGGFYTPNVEACVNEASRQGYTPLLISDDKQIVGAVLLKDIIKGGIRERIAQMRKMGIRTVMVTGDNALIAANISAEAGVDDFIAEATPAMKLALIKAEQKSGKLVAMTGDGTNDAPALAQADVGVAMNTGTQISREAGNMVDLDSNPTKLIDIVEIGKQMLMTRGALTIFTIATDIAKYFALIPALFAAVYVTGDEKVAPLSIMNIMQLHSAKSAIISTLIFNALIIIALIPIALHGVKYRAESADVLLRKNVLIYGVGGIIAPFAGIKIIDMLLSL